MDALLDEAIAKAKADGDVQIAEWLRQARGADAAARWYTEKLRDANRTIRKLLDENARLQELVRDMWCCISHIGEYDVFYYDMAKDGCGISCTVNGEHCCADKLHDCMRELGIEVSS